MLTTLNIDECRTPEKTPAFKLRRVRFAMYCARNWLASRLTPLHDIGRHAFTASGTGHAKPNGITLPSRHRPRKGWIPYGLCLSGRSKAAFCHRLCSCWLWWQSRDSQNT